MLNLDSNQEMTEIIDHLLIENYNLFDRFYILKSYVNFLKNIWKNKVKNDYWHI
jgi:hypothetical protein